MKLQIHVTEFLIFIYCMIVSKHSYACANQRSGEKATNNSYPYAHFKLVGEGKMQWLWFKLYQAKLYTPSGAYQSQQWPLVLELVYTHHIDRDMLTKATQQEWQRQTATLSKPLPSATAKNMTQCLTQRQPTALR